MADNTPLRCRAQVSDACRHGTPSCLASWDSEYTMEEDGTWWGQSVVCDPCYIMLMPLTPSGQGLNSELPFAIALARDIRRPMEQRMERFESEARQAGFAVRTTRRENGDAECTAYASDGTVAAQWLLEEGQPPRQLA